MKKNIKSDKKGVPTLELLEERDIAMDFASKVYKKFDKLVKSVILFGSTTKNTRKSGSDIDIIIIIDDASVQFDQELIAWYREELGKIIQTNPYKKELHINTVKLTTWWNDMIKGDPILINILRYGEALIDFGGFFNPLKILLQEGKIRPSSEAIYTSIQRAPQHLARSKQAELSCIEGVYWAMVDSAHALLIAGGLMPPSPEHIPIYLEKHFVNERRLEKKYVDWFVELFELHKKILHGEIRDIKGQDIDDWQEKAEEFMKKMAELIYKTVK